MADSQYYQDSMGGWAPKPALYGGRGSQFMDNNAPKANHGAQPAPDRTSVWDDAGRNDTDSIPGDV